MDHHFLEFIGNYFIHAAQYQKGTDDFLAWMRQGGKGSKELASMFKEFYNIDGRTSSDEFARAFQRFQDNYMALFSIPGMIPEKKYQELEKKYNQLKEKYDRQKETIRTLSSMTTMNDTFQKNINQGIDHVMKNQQEMFENMINSLKPKKQ